MAKLFAILAASAAIAGGATFAVFHHLDPNHCPLTGCEITKPACCAVPPAESATADPAVCLESPVTTTETPCCALAKGRACCATTIGSGALVAAVGPAAVR